MEIAEDMEIDIPHVWKFFGELIGPLILDHVLPLPLINECIVELISSKSKQAKLMAEILITAVKESVRRSNVSPRLKFYSVITYSILCID